ncbi:unnamed protein product, partial [marine sediment metagenome]
MDIINVNNMTEINNIPLEWKSVAIKDISKIVTKGTTPTTLGKKFVKKGINYIKVESITKNGDFIVDKFAHIDEDTNIKLKRSQIQEDDVLFSIAGVIGRTAIARKEILPANTNQALAIIRPNTKIIDAEYLRYSLSNPRFIKLAKTKIVQSVQANLSLTVLKNSLIYLPPIEEQKAIADKLLMMDKKIQNNTKICLVLNKICTILFKRWFVDFEYPNDEGKPYKSNGGEMVTSEMGEIPKGWNSGVLSDVVST